MVMRSATMIVPRSVVPMITVAVVVGMRQAIRVGGNFPVLERMHGMGGGQKGQAGQPKDAEAAPECHQ